MKNILTIFTLVSLLTVSQQNYACCINVDELKIEELKNNNVDVSKPYVIRFHIILNTHADAIMASQEAQSIGYIEEESYEYATNSHSLWLSKKLVPNTDNLMKVYKELYPIAIKYNGIYNDADWYINEKG